MESSQFWTELTTDHTDGTASTSESTLVEVSG